MSKQKREIEIDVPDGWRIKEVVARSQDPYKPDTGTLNHMSWADGKGFVYFTAILEIEPDHVNLAKWVKTYTIENDVGSREAHQWANNILAKWARGEQ